MPDPFGIIDGTKQVTKTLNESVKASEELSKAIDGVLAVADKAAKERAASRKNSRVISPDTTTIIEAVDEQSAIDKFHELIKFVNRYEIKLIENDNI